MAKKRIPQFLGLNHSLFAIKVDSRRRNMPVLSPHEDDGPLSSRQEIEAAFASYALTRCARSRVSTSKSMEKAVASLIGRPVSGSVAWGWMLDEFLKANPKFHTPRYEEHVQVARWRVKKMRRNENRAIEKARLERESAEAQKQYAAERKANGADFVFFNSNKWQRLRYDVLLASNGCCSLCGRSTRTHGVTLEVDHIKPRSRFPNLSLDKTNLQVLCFDCNRGKSNRDTTDWRTVPENDDNPQADAA